MDDLEEELEKLRWELEVETSFRKLAVNERNFERLRNERLDNEVRRLQQELNLLRTREKEDDD